MIAILVRVFVGPLLCVVRVLGSCLYVSVSGGSSSKETSCAISARVFTLNVPVLLMTIGIIFMSYYSVPWVCRACFKGSYMV